MAPCSASAASKDRRAGTRRSLSSPASAGLMEEPVKNYPPGMYVRLGFAVAVNTDPDVLLVDEVLAVGDEAFAHRCLEAGSRSSSPLGKTLLLVSHSLDLVEGVCDPVLWLDARQGARRRAIPSGSSARI